MSVIPYHYADYRAGNQPHYCPEQKKQLLPEYPKMA
jgi:hypothetical protein